MNTLGTAQQPKATRQGCRGAARWVVRSRSLYRVIVSLLVLPLVSAYAQVAEGVAPLLGGGRGSYTLFTGTHVEILHQGKVRRLYNVEKDALVVLEAGQGIRIPMRSPSETLKIVKSQKLTDRWATVMNLKHDRGYTAAHDPYRMFAEDMYGMRFAEATAKRLETLQQKSKGAPEGTTNATSPGVNAERARLATGANLTVHTQRFQDRVKREVFDVLEVKFEVASERPIQEPYVVLTARIREKDDPRYTSNWLYAKSLPPVGATPVEVSIREAGFPPGFSVDNLQVHLYEKGEEIATDLSENRATLTREEAHEYLVLTYLGTQQRTTTPPKLAMVELPADWKTRRTEESCRRYYHVKVDSSGRVLGVFDDERCSAPAPATYGASVVADQLFYPALDKGKPVEGTLRVLPSGID